MKGLRLAAVLAVLLGGIVTGAPMGNTSELAPRTLTVRFQDGPGDEGGTVSGGGISCPSTCTASVEQGTQVTLTAQANGGRRLFSWGGACSGTPNTSTTCVVTVDTNKTVEVNFGFNLSETLVVTPPSNGVINWTHGTCPGVCEFTAAAGTPVQLTAVPNPGFQFRGWIGVLCAGQGITCNTGINGAIVSADIRPPAPQITSMNCVVIGIDQLRCTVATNPPGGLTIRWVDNATPKPQADNQTSYFTGCGIRKGLIVIKVTVTNSFGDSATATDSFQCGKEHQ